MLTVLGIDPGGRNTGIVCRRGEDLLGWTLCRRQGTARMPDGRYLSEVRAACTAVLEQAGLDYRDRDAYVVGVEEVAWWPASKQARMAGQAPRDQRGLYGTAMVVGGILTRWPAAIVVPSGRGVANLHPGSYPAPIRPPVNGEGKDRMKDVRAAWDHSHATETMYHRQTRGQL